MKRAEVRCGSKLEIPPERSHASFHRLGTCAVMEQVIACDFTVP